MNKAGISIISILATLGVVTGGVAVYNHLPNVQDKLTISVGESVLVGDSSNSGTTRPPEVVDVNTADIEKFAKENHCMMILAINLNSLPNSDGFESQLIRVNSAEEFKTALDNTYWEENATYDANTTWKGWSLSEDGAIIEDFESIFEEGFVTIYAVTEIYPAYALQVLGNPIEDENGGYYFKANKDGKITELPVDPEDQAPEGYSFAGWSTTSETGIDDIVDLSSVSLPQPTNGTDGVTIFYAVFVNDSGEAYDRNYFKSFEVTFNYDGNMSESITYTHYEFQSELPLPDMESYGYTFVGWYQESFVFELDENMLYTDIENEQLTGPIELFALYEDAEGNYYTSEMLGDIGQ